MGRAKLNLELIPKEKARNLTFKKRKEGIMKKMREFTTLCDVKACIIIYGPTGLHSSEPSIWPENRVEVERMINLYKEKGSDNATRAYELGKFFMDRRKKLEDELKKLKKKNLDAKYPTSIALLDRLTKPELQNFVRYLNAKLQASTARLEMMMNGINIEEHHHQQQPQEIQHFQGDYYINNPMIDPIIQMDNLGFVNNNMILDDHHNQENQPYGLLTYAANPNLARMSNTIMTRDSHEAGFIHLGGPSSRGGGYSYNNEAAGGYLQQLMSYYEPPPAVGGGVMAQYYMDRTAIQGAVAPPPYTISGLPPFPPSYLEVNEVKSTTLSQISTASYYLEDKETNGSSTFPAVGGGGPAPYNYFGQNESAGCYKITRY